MCNSTTKRASKTKVSCNFHLTRKKVSGADQMQQIQVVDSAKLSTVFYNDLSLAIKLPLYHQCYRML